MDNWLNYVQINLYGKGIDELKIGGIDSFLINIGCDKYWIGEVPMYRGDSDSGVDSSFEDTVILSTTTNQEQKFPRCSTPRDSKIGRIFTLGPSKFLSKIPSETSTEEFLEITGSINQSTEIIMENNEETEVLPISDSFEIQEKDLDIVSDLLDSVIDVVCKTDIQNDLSIFEDCKNDSFETTFSNQQLSSNNITQVNIESEVSMNQLEFDEKAENTELVDSSDVQNEDFEVVSNLLKSVVDIICETETECDSSIFEDCENLSFATTSSDFNSVVKSSGELPIFYGPHPAIRHSEIETKPAVTKNITEKKPRISTNRSVQNLMIPENSIEMEKERERKPLKRTTSEIRRNRRKAMKLLRNNTVVPNIGEIQLSNSWESKILIPTVKSQISGMDYDNLSYQSITEQFENQDSTQFPTSDDSQRVYTDLTPLTSDGEQYCEIEQNFFEMAENRLDSETNQQEVNEDSLMYNSENGEKEQESWVDQEIELDLDKERGRNEEEIEENEEEEKNEECGSESSRKELEDDQNDSLLSAAINDLSENEDEDEEETEKEEEKSEKEQKVGIQVKRRQKRCNIGKADANKQYNISCQFKGCKYSTKWRPKFGKLRLLDHVFTHLSEKLIRCHDCDFSCQTSRQIRYHYKKQHQKTSKVNGYGIYEMFSLRIENSETISQCWESCYKDKLDVIGKAILKATRRRS